MSAAVASTIRALRPEGSAGAYSVAFVRARERIADDVERVYDGILRRAEEPVADRLPLERLGRHLANVADGYSRDALLAIVEEWHVTARARAALYRSAAAVVFAHLDAVAGREAQ